jgi:hypothetical protein
MTAIAGKTAFVTGGGSGAGLWHLHCEPERLAGYVLKAVEANQLYILPYPEFRTPLEDTHGQVMAALAKPEDDPEYEMRAAKGVPGGARAEGD